MDNNGKIHVGTDKSGSAFFTSHMVIDTNVPPGKTPTPVEISFGGEVSQSNVSIDEDGTSYGLKDGKFTAIDSTGKELWASPLTDSSTLSFSKIGKDGKLYAGIGNYAIACFDKSGSEQWRLKAAPGSESFSGNIETDGKGTVYISASSVSPVTRMGQGILLAINPDGTRKWEKNADYSPVILVGKDGTIYNGDLYKKLEAINPDKGNVIGSTPFSACRGSIKQTEDNSIISADSNGKVRMFHFTTIKESAQSAMDALTEPARQDQNTEKPQVKIEQDNVVIGNVKIPINRRRE
jgi:hypothetical protein